jgi:hypothetical protein
MIKKYLNFIKEADETGINDSQDKKEETTSDSSKFTDVVDAIKSMVEKTIEKSGGELKAFVDSYIKNPDDVKIEGFINDSDVYEFYLKWRNDIDEILSDVNFFDELPSENNAFGLYEYVIKGTQKAFLELIKSVK